MGSPGGFEETRIENGKLRAGFFGNTDSPIIPAGNRRKWQASASGEKPGFLQYRFPPDRDNPVGSRPAEEGFQLFRRGIGTAFGNHMKQDFRIFQAPAQQAYRSGSYCARRYEKQGAEAGRRGKFFLQAIQGPQARVQFDRIVKTDHDLSPLPAKSAPK
jgi:hypothetical protein